jgi:secreted trypsin-like serine protease
VLTAAHCLFTPKTLRPVQLKDVHFVAGWRRGAYRAHRKAKRLILHPQFDIHAKTGRVRHDLAVVELTDPIDAAEIPPMSRIGNAYDGNAVFTVTYGRDRPHLPSTEDPCFVAKPFRWAIGLTCDAPFGSSGGPVFRRTENGLRLIGVISGRVSRQAPVRSFAVRLSNVLPQVLAAE